MFNFSPTTNSRAAILNFIVIGVSSPGALLKFQCSKRDFLLYSNHMCNRIWTTYLILTCWFCNCSYCCSVHCGCHFNSWQGHCKNLGFIQGYRNRYNLIDGGHKKNNLYVSLKKGHQAAVQRFSELIKNLSDVQKSKTFT